MTPPPRYPTDLDSLGWHADGDVPTPLAAFYDWCGRQPWGSFGAFRLEGGRLDDFDVAEGTRCARVLLSFLRCADGGRVGFWRPAGEALCEASIVLVGHGEVTPLAASLAGFWWRLAEGRTGVDDLDEGDDRERLKQWLSDRGVEPKPAVPSPDGWLRSWEQARLDEAAACPLRARLTALLEAEIGRPDEAWKRTEALVECAGPRFAFYWEGEHFPMGDAMEEALRAQRELDRAALPEAGRWHEVVLRLGREGPLSLCRSYLMRPSRRDTILDDEAFRQELAEAPRSRYWLPPWMGAGL